MSVGDLIMLRDSQQIDKRADGCICQLELCY
jgi:hypothetical protein